ncbi:autotransporter domain-containing protein [uncultured Roseibium sp.]|uniref:autotransporter outer membrane beta-barrel domain-containing protein n=1 Tax=uncultured Roseibium sp. TaxID=1936171 RepID=UPI0032168571
MCASELPFKGRRDNRSISGTLTVKGGDVEFVDGSTLVAELASDGTSDLLKVVRDTTGGTVTISNGTTLSVSAVSGASDSDYAIGTSHKIISATNGVTGTFTTVTDNFAFLNADVTYDTNDVSVALQRNGNTFGSTVSGNNTNARSAAYAVSSLGESDPLYKAAVWSQNGNVDKTFQTLSGDTYVGTSTAMMAETGVTRNVVDSRIRSSFSGVAAMQMAEVATHGDKADEEVQASGGPVLWAKGYGNWAQLDGSTGVTGLRSFSGGAIIGMDREILDGWRAGLFAGYGNTHTRADGVDATSDTDTYQIGAIGLRLGASYGWNDVSADRTVTVASLTNDLGADYSAQTGQGFIELGYLARYNATRFEPFANQAIVYQRTDSFTESGGAAALSVDSSELTQGITTLGVRFEQDLSKFLEGPVSLTGSLAWQHTFGDVDAETSMRFLSGGNTFRVTGAALDRDQAAITAGFRGKVGQNATLDITYEGTLGNDSQSHGAEALLTLRF